MNIRNLNLLAQHHAMFSRVPFQRRVISSVTRQSVPSFTSVYSNRSAFLHAIPSNRPTLQLYNTVSPQPETPKSTQSDSASPKSTPFRADEDPRNHRQKRANRRLLIRAILSLFGIGAAWCVYRYMTRNGELVYSELFSPMPGTNGSVFTNTQVFLLMGISNFPTNAFAARLQNGDVLVYNACFLTAELKEQIVNSIMGPNGGTVHLVVANNAHTLFVDSWIEGFRRDAHNVQQFKRNPQCIIYARESNEIVSNKMKKAAGKDEKGIPSQVVIKTVSDFPRQILNEFDVQLIAGLPPMDEIVLFHKRSKMLVCCDMAQHVTSKTFPPGFKANPLLWAFFRYIAYSVDRLAAPGELKIPFLLGQGNKTEFYRSAMAMCSYPFQGIFMAHGEPVAPLRDAKINDLLKEDYRRLLGTAAKKE